MFFLKNHMQNVVVKLVPDTFQKSQNWGHIWINSLEFYTFCFYCIPIRVLPKYIKTKLLTTCFYLTCETTTLPALFSAWFLKKNVSYIIFYQLAKFHCLIVFSSWEIEQSVFYNYLFRSRWCHKLYNILRLKRLLKVK